MNAMKVTVYEHAAELPVMPAGSFFHSPELMIICEQTPRLKPYMVVVDDKGSVVSHMLAIVRYRGSWLPPFLYTHVQVMGQGDYSSDDSDHQQLFGLMAEAITSRFQYRALYIEYSHMLQKMFGYRPLRKLGYFPVRWTNIHNSLHSRTPEERISDRQLKRISNALTRGIETKQVETDEEFQAFSKLLRQHNWLKPRRFIPADNFFRGMMKNGHCKLFISSVHQRVVGSCACVYSGTDAFLWYSASRRKSYAAYHPNAVTFWHAIKDAHASGYQHIRFIDVGLPFRRNPYRDFILSFGGKETSSYRWFRISIRWVNRLASWLWRE